MTSPCPLPAGQIYGPLRDCEMSAVGGLRSCAAGDVIRLSCRIPDDAAPQVVRFCEGSRALGAGTACRVMDQSTFGLTSSTLANVVVEAGSATDVSFTCPTARDAEAERGGFYAVYMGAVWNGVDRTARDVDCN